jgi:DNA-binding MarR family transcriptional regulator
MNKLPDSSTVEPSAARRRQLSDEVGRIAETLAQFALGSDVAVNPGREPPAGDDPGIDIAVEMVQCVIQARRLRNAIFDKNLFADPAWDMLLTLLEAEIAQRRMTASSLCVAAGVPATTALRWIKVMTDAGLVRSREGQEDARRVVVELSPIASQAMRRYFNQIGKLQSLLLDYPVEMPDQM